MNEEHKFKAGFCITCAIISSAECQTRKLSFFSIFVPKQIDQCVINMKLHHEIRLQQILLEETVLST